ncbi:MAG: hypothetical protein OXG99_04870 [Alphaproteobacteria bacterium]|nr:hypothetical protein [Alphaproteobacteria bacterium]
MKPTDSNPAPGTAHEGTTTEADVAGNDRQRHVHDPIDDIFPDPGGMSEPRSPYDVEPWELEDARREAAEQEQYLEELAAEERYERRHRTDYVEEIMGEMDGTIGDEEPYDDPEAHHHDRWAAQDNARFSEEAARRR